MLQALQRFQTFQTHQTEHDGCIQNQGPSSAVLVMIVASLLAFAVQAQAARNEDQLVAQDRANKAAAERSWAAASSAASAHSTSSASSAAERPMHKPVLPLDHGPHAATTPWMNHLRMEHFNEENGVVTSKAK